MSDTRGPASRRVAPAGNQYKPDALMYAVGLMGLTYVWRIQDILLPLAVIRFPTLVGLTALVIYESNRLHVRRIRFVVRSPIVGLLCVFAFIIAAGIPTSLLASKTLTFLMKDYIPDVVMVVLIAVCVRGMRDVDWLLGLHMVGALVFGVYALLFFDLDDSGRLGHLLYYDGNDLALAIVTTLPIAIYFLRDGSPRWQRRLTLLVVPVLLLNFIRAASRGGFLGLIIVIVCLMVGYQPIKRRRRIAALAVCVVVIAIVGGTSYWEKMKTIFAPHEDYNMQSETGRWQIWQNGLSVFSQRPILGVGARLFPEGEATLSDLGRLRTEMRERQLPWQAAHNSYISVAAETGIFGFLVFVSLLVTAIGTALKIMRVAPGSGESDMAALSRALAIAFAGYAVSAFFLSAEYQAILYLNIGFLLAVRKLVRRSQRSHANMIAAPASEPSVLHARPQWRQA